MAQMKEERNRAFDLLHLAMEGLSRAIASLSSRRRLLTPLTKGHRHRRFNSPHRNGFLPCSEKRCRHCPLPDKLRRDENDRSHDDLNNSEGHYERQY